MEKTCLRLKSTQRKAESRGDEKPSPDDIEPLDQAIPEDILIFLL